MRVAIDVSALSSGLRSGTAVYLYRLVQALAELRDGPELVLLYNGMPGAGAELAASLTGPRVSLECAYLKWRPLPAPVFWRPYPRRLTRAVRSADVFHVGEYVFPDPGPTARVVATVHDVTTRLFPQWHTLPNRMLHERRLRWIRRYAHRVIIDAEATRRDTARELGRDPGTLAVVPLARGTAGTGAPGLEADDVRRRFGIGDEPYVLFVGVLEPRKNLARLIRAFELLSPELTEHWKLVLAGEWGWHTRALRKAISSSPLRHRIVTTGPVESGTLEALYAAAGLFAYPSLYEGFGLPLLEAMAAAVPVLTSRGGALQEVAGDAALLVDPEDVGSIRDGLERALLSAELRAGLAERGRVREAQFTWERTAAATYRIYRELARQ